MEDAVEDDKDDGALDSSRESRSEASRTLHTSHPTPIATPTAPNVPRQSAVPYRNALNARAPAETPPGNGVRMAFRAVGGRLGSVDTNDD